MKAIKCYTEIKINRNIFDSSVVFLSYFGEWNHIERRISE